MPTTPDVSTADVAILRDLAQRVRAAAESDVNQERLQAWYAHDTGTKRPLILTETDGGIHMVKPDFAPRTQAGWAQGQEWGLAMTLLHFEELGDDYPIEPAINVAWAIGQGTFGVEQQVTRPKDEGFKGAYHIDAPIGDLAAEFDRLQPRTFTVDRESTLAQKGFLDEVYDGILSVRLRNNPWWTMGLTWTAINLIGLENLMLYMYDEPEPLHRLMAFLRDDRLAFLDWLEREELLVLNNENDYIGSGSRGYTRRLPGADWTPGTPVRATDLWSLIESQETVGVGPDLYGEFIFPYENALGKRFGGVYYGCCEPVNTRWEILKGMAGLKRVSVSPWCDEAFMAAACGTEIVYSRKPNPSLISTTHFDEDAIRADLRGTLTQTKQHNCAVEIVMKDVHTLSGHPARMARWVQLAREVVAEVYG
jgi:hypothetical protein